MKLSQLRTYIKEEIKNLKQEADENELMKKLTIEPIKGAGAELPCGPHGKICGSDADCMFGYDRSQTSTPNCVKGCCQGGGGAIAPGAMRSGNQTTLGPEGGGRGPGLYDVSKRAKGF